jgi:threonyl-tRNA synthetase
MLHRAIVGSLERFIGILIEQHAGALPAWLAPVQVVVASITDAQAEYVAEVVKSLQKQGVRVQADLRNEKITIKSASIQCKRSRTSWSLATRRRQTGPLPCAPGATRTSV